MSPFLHNAMFAMSKAQTQINLTAIVRFVLYMPICRITLADIKKPLTLTNINAVK